MQRENRADIVVILADDHGYSDIDCFGSEVESPRLDISAAAEVGLSSLTNTLAVVPPELTGQHLHQTGVGLLTGKEWPGGYRDWLERGYDTIAEMLGDVGFRAYMSGKWHAAYETDRPDAAWETSRGVDRRHPRPHKCLVVGGHPCRRVRLLSSQDGRQRSQVRMERRLRAGEASSVETIESRTTAYASRSWQCHRRYERLQTESLQPDRLGRTARIQRPTNPPLVGERSKQHFVE